MDRYNPDDHRDWPPDLITWYEAQEEERKEIWRTGGLFDGIDRETGNNLMQKIAFNDAYNDAFAQAAANERSAEEAEQVAYWDEGEALLAVMQQSQENAERITAEQNEAFAKRYAEQIKAGIAEDAKTLDDN